MSENNKLKHNGFHFIIWGEKFYGNEKKFIGNILVNGLLKQIKENPNMKEYNQIIPSFRHGRFLSFRGFLCYDSKINPNITCTASYTSGNRYGQTTRYSTFRTKMLSVINGIFFLFDNRKEK